MDINLANLTALRQTYTLAFQEGLAVQPLVDISFFVRTFPSATAANFYAWVDRVAKFRQWLGPRNFENVRGNKFIVPNLEWEDSVSLTKQEIRDDQYGVYGPLTQMMGEAWTLLKYEWPLGVLTGNPLCFTGKNIFAVDHKYGDHTIANLVADALSKTSFEAAFTAATGYYFSNGELCRTRWTHLVHGPALHATAFGIVDAQFIAAAGVSTPIDNPNYKRVTRVEVPDLGGAFANYWFLLDCSRPVKPVALQVREEAAPLMDVRPEQVERSGQFDIMASGSLNASPTFPHLMYGGIL